MLCCYVEFVYRRQFTIFYRSTIASLEANQNWPKIKNYVNKYYFLFYIHWKFKTVILIWVHTKTWSENRISQKKNINIDGSRTPTSSQKLFPVTLFKQLKAVIKLFFFFLLKASVGLNFSTLAFISMKMKSNTNSLKQIKRKSGAVGMK